MMTFWMGAFFGFVSVALVCAILYQFHEMNVHPDRYHESLTRED